MSTVIRSRELSSFAGYTLILAGFLATVGSAFGQDPPVTLQPGNVSQVVLYDHLFHHVQFLEDRAADLEASGHDARTLRDHYREPAGLTAVENSALMQVARDVNAKVAEQDRRAQEIIAAIRAKHPGGRLPAGDNLPKPPPELIAMQEARDQMVRAGINQLRTRIGAERFAQFDAFVNEEVRSKVSWTPVVVTPPQP